MVNLASGLLTLVGYVPYIRTIILGKTRPSRVSWWVWSCVGLMLISTYYGIGGRMALGLALGALAGQIVIAILSLRYGQGKATALDRFCLVGALATAVLWYVTSSPVLPHILILVIDGFGWLPTFKKALLEAKSEDLLSWLIWTIAGAVTLVDSSRWDIFNLMYPVYIVVTDGLIVMAVFRHRFRS